MPSKIILQIPFEFWKSDEKATFSMNSFFIQAEYTSKSYMDGGGDFGFVIFHDYVIPADFGNKIR
jgi:hypothetical protein